MGIDLARLRGAEWLAGAAAVVMAVVLFAVPWYGPRAAARSARTGWTGTAHLHWLLLVAIAVGLALAAAQAACRAPAIPASLSVVSTVISLIAVLWLVFRVVIAPAPRQQAGAWLELAAACALLAGAFVSMRQEGIADRDGPGEIPVVDVRGA